MNDFPFLPFAKPCISEDAIAETVACLRSGWLTTGTRVERFEAMLSDYHGGRRALCVASATAGLHLALLALELEEGDEVITTPLTFAATLNTIVLAGGTPVLADIDPATLNLEMQALEAAITPRTRVILPVHFAGLPVDLDPLYALARKHSLRVVEDCAHAIGAHYQGKRIGASGDIQVMSFHPNKNITTGEGGCVLTDDAGVIACIERLRFHGIDRQAFHRFAKSDNPHYDVVIPGYKYNMMDIQAALGLHQLPLLDQFIDRRAALAQRYLDALSGTALRLPAAPAYSHRHAWHLFTIRVPHGRDALLEAMKARNIGLGMHYRAVHSFSYYQQRYGWQNEDFPEAFQAGETICSLPLFPDLTYGEQDRVIDALREVLTL